MLNTEQRKAAEPSYGAVLVLAGAGSGKTRTLIERMSACIEKSLCLPENILVMTFSRKSAEEIRERVEIRFTGTSHETIKAGTFHSVALAILQEYRSQFIRKENFERFPSIIDESKKVEIQKEIFSRLKDNFLGIPFHVVSSLKGVHELETIPEQSIFQAYDKYCSEYVRIKKERCLCDYEDIMFYATGLIKSDEFVKEDIHKKYKFIFVDEYQDISSELFEFVALIAGKNGNLFAVGDDRQSIYGFRGAEIGYIINFKKYYPNCSVFHLEQNYRSNSEIVSLAELLISRNRLRTKSITISAIGKGGRIRSYPVLSEDDEFTNIVKTSDLLNVNYSVAILCRDNLQVEYFKNRISSSDNDKLKKYDVMTIHASKGLEFDVVFIPGIEDRIFPSYRSPLEEERRLFYVAITRAKKYLILLYRYDGITIPQFIRETTFSRGWLQKSPFLFAADRHCAKNYKRQICDKEEMVY